MEPDKRGKTVDKIEPMGLEIKFTEDGDFAMILDGKKLRFVESYEIKSSARNENNAELSLKMLVKYPVKKECSSKQPVSPTQQE